MRPRVAKRVLCAALPLAMCLFFSRPSTALAAQAGAAQSGQAAYETSLPFDLEPRVERASLDLRRPSVRSLYDAIAQAYGIRLLYDRDLGETPVASDFRVQDATLQEALDAAGSVTRTFVAPLDPRTGIVAADTPEKRGEYERQVLGSFHMDDQTTTQQLTEISTALRNLLDLRRVTQDSRLNWITARGRARQMAVAEQFVRTLQKTAGEVMLEVQVWEVNSRRARELGILPPQPFRLLYLGESGGGGSVPLRLLGLGRTFYGLQLAGLTALLNSSSSLVRSHQVFYLRAYESQQANLLVGDRFPVITSFVGSSFQSGAISDPLSSGGFYPAIQYEDVGVIIRATPYLHAGRELTLQLDLALRNLGVRDQNGLPTFGNRQITGQVRLRDGESFLLGGILNRADQRGVSGYPWLSRLPFLGGLFSSRRRQQDESELIFLIRPHVVRFDPAEEIASRSIFFGRELTGLPAAVEPPPQPEQPAPGVPPQPGVPQPGLPPGVAPVPGVPPQPGAQPQPGITFPGGFPGIGLPPGVIPQPVPPRQLPPQQPESPPEGLPQI